MERTDPVCSCVHDQHLRAREKSRHWQPHQCVDRVVRMSSATLAEAVGKVDIKKDSIPFMFQSVVSDVVS